MRIPFCHKLLCFFILCPTLAGCGGEAQPDSGLPAHHNPDGTFKNVYFDASGRGKLDVFRWLLGLGPKEASAVDQALVPPYVPECVSPRLDLIRNPDPDKLQVTWIGHSTFLIQVAGKNILTDPVWSERASPMPFLGPKRVAPPGVRFEDLPRIDLVLISHNHYDHLDQPTVKRLGNGPRWFMPLRLGEWFAGEGITNVAEADWWDTLSLGELAVTAVPAQHFTRRSLGDSFKTLWCGWVLHTPKGHVYFAGDTGLSPHMREIGGRLGPMRLALLPIGAYMPRWFMSPMHMNPAEAVQAREDVGAETAVAMHWGTFKLTDEALGEPPVFLRQALREKGLPDDAFRVLRFGETLALD